MTTTVGFTDAKTDSEYVKARLHGYLSEQPCQQCGGARLKAAANFCSGVTDSMWNHDPSQRTELRGCWKVWHAFEINLYLL